MTAKHALYHEPLRGSLEQLNPAERRARREAKANRARILKRDPELAERVHALNTRLGLAPLYVERDAPEAEISAAKRRRKYARDRRGDTIRCVSVNERGEIVERDIKRAEYEKERAKCHSVSAVAPSRDDE